MSGRTEIQQLARDLCLGKKFHALRYIFHVILARSVTVLFVLVLPLIVLLLIIYYKFRSMMKC
jgi:hypothetical protein